MTQHEELRHRTKQFALRIIRMFQSLPKTTEAQVIGKQLIRSATSVGANYRACGRAKSKADFVNKITIVLEEADETVFWLELLAESDILSPGQLRELIKESNELMAIFAASRNTLRSH